MKSKEREFCFYLEDIVASIEKIEQYTLGYDFIQFNCDSKTFDAVIRNLEIIGEASKNIPVIIKEKYSDIPWKEMYVLRNKVSHEYFGVDNDIIWDVITNHLPKNKWQIISIIKKECIQ